MQIITKQCLLVFLPRQEMNMFNDLPFCKGIWPNHETPVVLKIMILIFHISKPVYFVIEMLTWVKYDIRLKYLKGLNKLPLNYYTYGRLTQMILSSVAYRHMIYGYRNQKWDKLKIRYRYTHVLSNTSPWIKVTRLRRYLHV